MTWLALKILGTEILERDFKEGASLFVGLMLVL